MSEPVKLRSPNSGGKSVENSLATKSEHAATNGKVNVINAAVVQGTHCKCRMTDTLRQ